MLMRITITLILAFATMNNSFSQENENPPSEYRIVATAYSDPSLESVSNEIDLYLPMRIYFPSAFTPNGDGLNDTFGVIGEGIEAYQLTVYNRWGEIIFTSKNRNKKWDGSYQGKPVPLGEYNYELIAYGKEFGEVFTTGSVMVIN